MKRLLFLLVLLGLFIFAACGQGNDDTGNNEGSGGHEYSNDHNDNEDTDDYEDSDDYDYNHETTTDEDHGFSIITIGPAVTEIVAELGFGNEIIGIDSHSADVPGIGTDLPMFDMFALDNETLLILDPDIVFMTAMVSAAAEHAALLEDAGITTVLVGSAASIDEIYDIIGMIAGYLGAEGKGEIVINGMKEEIAEIRAIAANITDHRRVYFEIDPSPMFSFGGGTFLNELLETVGGVNIFADQEGWLMVSDEFILSENPDVIITNVGWLEDAAGDIAARPGWDGLEAVMNGHIYLIDGNKTSRANHNIVEALRQIGEAIYPEHFGR